MKLLFFLTYYTPHWTGLTEYARLLAEGLITKQISVRVVTTQHEPQLRKQEMLHGVDVRRKTPTFRLSRSIISLQLLLSMWQEIRQTDRVVIFLPFDGVLLATIIAKVLQKKVYLIHNGDLTLPKGLVNRILETIFFAMTAISIRLSSGVIVNTMDYAKQSPLLSRFLSTCIEIYPPIAAVPVTSAKTALVKKIGNHPQIIGFAGRFVEEKGFDILLKAIPLVLEKFPKAFFVYAGKPMAYEQFYEQCHDLIEQVKDHVLWLGKLPREQMGNFYTAVDIFTIPSRSDFFPFVQIETMLAGIPVVVSDIPGARVPVKKTGFGMIVPKEDPQALAEGIITVLQHRKTYHTKWNTVKNEFRAEQSLQKHLEVFL